MILSQNFSTNYNWKSLGQRLILENCLLFGLHPRLTSKKITKYLLGTRNTLEIFKLYELRYLLLKIYPLVHILFHNPRVNSRFKLQPLKTKSKRVKQKSMDSKKKKMPSKKTVFSFKHKNLPPQILFATTTEIFADIISQAANICNMPHHTNRWVNGTITAAIWNIYTKDFWYYTSDSAHKDVFSHFDKSWYRNKENTEKIKEKKEYYGRSRWPSLVVIPDISNNQMILSEIAKIGIPVMGLVNSHCTLEIDYPVFAQDQTISSVYFFCHFLATLIAKEMVYSQHKHYTLQKIQFQRKKKNDFFQQAVTQGEFKKDTRKIDRLAFFFQSILPLKIRFQNQHALSKVKTIYSAKKWKYKLFFWKRKKELRYKRLSKKLRVIFPLKPKRYKKIILAKKIKSKVKMKLTMTRRLRKQKKAIRKKYHQRNLSLYLRDKKRYKTRPSITEYFLALMRYFRDRRCDSFLFNRYENISQLLIKRQKKQLNPTEIIWKKEEKKKRFRNQIQNRLLKSDAMNLRKHRLPSFLWIFKTRPLYWKKKLWGRSQTFFTDNSYYWEQILSFLSVLSNWGDYKHFWRRLLIVKGKIRKTWKEEKRAREKKKRYLYKKYHQNHKVPFAKKSWKAWVKKNTKPRLQNKPGELLYKPKKTYNARKD